MFWILVAPCWLDGLDSRGKLLLAGEDAKISVVVALLLLLLLLSTNLYSAPNTPLASGTLHTKHEHNTKANTFKSLSKSLAICLSKKVCLDCCLKSCDIRY